MELNGSSSFFEWRKVWIKTGLRPSNTAILVEVDPGFMTKTCAAFISRKSSYFELLIDRLYYLKDYFKKLLLQELLKEIYFFQNLLLR